VIEEEFIAFSTVHICGKLTMSMVCAKLGSGPMNLWFFVLFLKDARGTQCRRRLLEIEPRFLTPALMICRNM